MATLCHPIPTQPGTGLIPSLLEDLEELEGASGNASFRRATRLSPALLTLSVATRRSCAAGNFAHIGKIITGNPTKATAKDAITNSTTTGRTKPATTSD